MKSSSTILKTTSNSHSKESKCLTKNFTCIPFYWPSNLFNPQLWNMTQFRTLFWISWKVRTRMLLNFHPYSHKNILALEDEIWNLTNIFRMCWFFECERIFKDTIFECGYFQIENDQQSSTRHENSSETFDSLPGFSFLISFLTNFRIDYRIQLITQ